jgi:phosphoglycolate phosphatase-like HAD superfamily hydrolase
VAGYFMKALRERYVLGTAQLALDEAQRASGHGSSGAAKARASAADVIAQTPKSDERYAQESAAGWRCLEALPQPEQAALLAEFLARPAARLAASGDQVDLAEVTLERIEALPILAHNFGAFVFLQKSPRA